jgi:hypothetical protein
VAAAVDLDEFVTHGWGCGEEIEIEKKQSVVNYSMN